VNHGFWQEDESVLWQDSFDSPELLRVIGPFCSVALVALG
jgi:hypothetical protein